MFARSIFFVLLVSEFAEALQPLRPLPSRRRTVCRATAPQMEERTVKTVLEELDAAVAAEGELRAARIKTEAEKIAKRKAEQDALASSGRSATHHSRKKASVSHLPNGLTPELAA